MCAHPDHEVVTLPDGQVDETHVFTDEDMERLRSTVERATARMLTAAYAHAFPMDVS
ncbi:hypothetical protein QFZ66_002394 [Streptomyces sp. B4I13]|uniref:hypothetical protein n=1 Tax=Streptomyces sp. B4I13 TaxID=3042271 RepID=UPI00278335D1|nr:hypothetical protein [Streptomyces sp. B4I13]MDQ0958516.1 hypothetical protein [Streptomyces sp. B4I13]